MQKSMDERAVRSIVERLARELEDLTREISVTPTDTERNLQARCHMVEAKNALANAIKSLHAATFVHMGFTVSKGDKA